MLLTLIILTGIIGAIAVGIFFLLRMLESIKTIEDEQMAQEQRQKEINTVLQSNMRKALDIENIQKLEQKIENIQKLIDNSKTGVEDLKSRQLEEIAERLHKMEDGEEDRIKRLISEMEQELVFEMNILNDKHENTEERIKLLENNIMNGDYLSYQDVIKTSDENDDIQEIRQIIEDTNNMISDYVNSYDKVTRNKETEN